MVGEVALRQLLPWVLPAAAPPARPEPWSCVLAGLAGALVFLMRFGLAPLDPTNLDWVLLQGDAAMHHLGWEVFRSSPWQWPPGGMDAYLAPVGSTIAMTDSIPLLALPLKLLAGGGGASFQYLGPWLFLGHVLQGCLGAMLVGRFVAGRALQLVGAGFFLLAPAFLFRHGHIALASHWLLLAAFYLSLRPRGTRIPVVHWLALAGLSALVHPYLMAMVVSLAAADAVRGVLPGTHGLARPAMVALGVPVVVCVASWASGAFFAWGDTIPQGAPASLDWFNWNLNSFFNPGEFSRLLPPLPSRSGQYEGYSYLGVGVLALLPILLVFLLLRGSARRSLHLLPMALAVALWVVFSTSGRWSWGEHDLLIVMFDQPVEDQFRALRATGRFAWPLMYLLVLSAVVAAARLLPRRGAIAILAGLALAQAWELTPLLDQRALAGQRYASPLQDPFWDSVATKVDRVWTWPPMEASLERPFDFRHWVLLGRRHGLATSAGYAARVAATPTAAFRRTLSEQLSTGDLDARTLYVVQAGSLTGFLPGLRQGARIGWVDGYTVVLPEGLDLTPPNPTWEAPTSLASFLRSGRADRALVVISEDGVRNLDDASRSLLASMGAPVDSLVYLGSWAGLIEAGRFVRSDAEASGVARITVRAGTRLGPSPVPRELAAWSGRVASGRPAGFRVGDREWVALGRGLNFLLLDGQFRPLQLWQFDTHAGWPGFASPPIPEAP